MRARLSSDRPFDMTNSDFEDLEEPPALVSAGDVHDSAVTRASGDDADATLPKVPITIVTGTCVVSSFSYVIKSRVARASWLVMWTLPHVSSIAYT